MIVGLFTAAWIVSRRRTKRAVAMAAVASAVSLVLAYSLLFSMSWLVEVLYESTLIEVDSDGEVDIVIIGYLVVAVACCWAAAVVDRPAAPRTRRRPDDLGREQR